MTRFTLRPLRRIRVLWALILLPLAACATTSGRPPYFPPSDPQSYFTVTVRPGDTVSAIAYRYQVDDDVLLSMNDIGDPDAIMAGTMIHVPSYGHLRDKDEAPMIEPRPKPDFAYRTPVSYEPRNDRIDQVPLPQPKPVIAAAQPDQSSSWWGSWFGSSTTVTPSDTTTSEPVPETHVSAPPKNAVSSKGFLWPVSGQVLSGFGSGRGGERNDGINIAASRGTPVRASAAGTVSYVGNELKGYGNLVLIKHDNGYVTAYAHADSVAVERGEHVTQGQVIAYAGDTGDVSRPQVHFELRQGTKPVNPATFLVASD